MKKLFVYVILMSALLTASISAGAEVPEKDGRPSQERTAPAVRLAYDLDLEMNFDNREFYKSRFSRSMTIFGVRLSPAVGIDVGSDNGMKHRVMAGVDVMKDFGGKSDVLGEVTLYYNMEKQIGRTGLSVYAGVFPRRMTEGLYSQAFFSDSLRFYDNNLEGLLLKFRRPSAYFELGCDWMGQFGDDVRERFMVYASGEGKVAPVLSLGYSGYLYHFANSRKASGVVDNILLNPYARFDLGHLLGLQAFSVRLGWLQSMQNDRKHVGIYTFPYGGELDLEIRNWNFGVENRMFYGMDMMPYYNNLDSAGIKYGSSLYFGDPFYRVHDDGKSGAGLYDRFEVFWEPKTGKMLSVKVGAVFHFHDWHYSGCQQVVRLCFNLNSKNKLK